MNELDHHTTSDLLDKFGLSTQVLASLFVFSFVSWALLAPEFALTLSLMGLVLSNSVVGAAVVISNAIQRSRALAFQDSIGVMVHANSLHMPEDTFDFPSGSIDHVLSLTDGRTRAARESAERVEGNDFASTVFAFLQAFAGQIALISVAGACGLYLANDVSDWVTWFVSSVEAFR